MGNSTFHFTVNLRVYVFQNILFASLLSDVIKFFNKRSFEIAADFFF